MLVNGGGNKWIGEGVTGFRWTKVMYVLSQLFHPSIIPKLIPLSSISCTRAVTYQSEHKNTTHFLVELQKEFPIPILFAIGKICIHSPWSATSSNL
jgi:hypothetical protein